VIVDKKFLEIIEAIDNTLEEIGKHRALTTAERLTLAQEIRKAVDARQGTRVFVANLPTQTQGKR
jgi:hypothetical protein